MRQVNSLIVTERRSRGWWPILVAAALLGAASQLTIPAQAAGPEGALSAAARTGRIGPGRLVQVPSSDVPYLPNRDQAAAQQLALTNHLAPALGPRTNPAASANLGAPTDGTVKQGPGDLTIFKKSLIHAPTCGGCGLSSVNEPSAANSGTKVVETSNWDLAFSANGGTTFVHLNPYTLSPGFCCDQEVAYNADRDIFLLLQLDYAGEGAATNGFQLSIAHGSTITAANAQTTWCTYKFTGANFGEGATDTLDFPKLAVSNNNVFVTWNDYPPSSGFAASGLVRLPLDPLAACAGVGYTYITRNTEFTFALANSGAHDQFYWVSNWFLDGTASGSNLRIFYWPDNSGTYFWVTPGINPYTFGTSCPSGGWCSRLDPRYESVVITPAEFLAQSNGAFCCDQTLMVATTSGPGGGDPFNYVVYNYFHVSTLAYIGSAATFNDSFNFAYPGCAVNAKGYIGCAMVQDSSGGAPGGIIVLQDETHPVQPWDYNFIVAGISNATAWGDYVVTTPWLPAGGPFQTVLWNQNGGVVQPYYIIFGEGSDTNDYNRWKAK